MESSETQKRIISLGKLLVEGLERDHSSQPVTHWMAHYVAQLIVEAETATAENKEMAQKRCFEAVLMLWSHRSSLPHGSRPLEDFEPLFETLNRLSPENPRFWYNQYVRGDEVAMDEEATQTLAVIENIDRAARILMNELLSFAVESCRSEDTLRYLKNLKGETEDADIRLAVRLFEVYKPKTEEAQEDGQRKQLTERIETLNRFIKGAVKMRNMMQARLS
jgi:hypothetical protein